MPATTFLRDEELDQPTGDNALDALLSEAQSVTGRNYQIVMHSYLERHGLLGLRKCVVERPQLYVDVPGIGPWQVIGCAHDAATTRAFLLGLLNGCRRAEETTVCPGPGKCDDPGCPAHYATGDD